MSLRVLIVEDDREYGERIAEDCAQYGILSEIIIDLETALDLVENNGINAFDGIMLDGVIFAAKSRGGDATTLSLITPILEQGFTGPLIAMSGLDDLRRTMRASGCTHEAEKWECASLIATLLGVS